AVIDLLRGGQGVLNILPLAGVVEEIDAAVTSLRDRPPAGEKADRSARPTPAAEAASGTGG
ncbi:MAG TPA: hypothetical protein VGR90_07650, partial [Acidimicrobiales bacterium]|nr:hypothetical protein [Acidimicrobiales bacterium]